MITKDSKNVFVADDSIFFRTKLSDILVESGHKVRFAKDGREIIAEMKIDPDGIDLLVLDLQMPGIDGFEVLKWLNDNGFRGRFPILVVTAVYEPDQVMDNLKKLGASGLMTKGFTPEQIIFRVNRLLFPDKTSQRIIPERVPVSLPVDFALGEKTQTGFMLNISEGGIFLHTKDEILVGSMLHMRFSLPGAGKIFDVKGIVKWSTNNAEHRTLFGGYGVMFTSLSDTDAAIIKGFVDEEIKKIGADNQ
ncbi:MAG: response regulator [Deltaproteobacteria bacterium]|nr:response regulator [Deltaproteobacteria bacterium]